MSYRHCTNSNDSRFRIQSSSRGSRDRQDIGSGGTYLWRPSHARAEPEPVLLFNCFPKRVDGLREPETRRGRSAASLKNESGRWTRRDLASRDDARSSIASFQRSHRNLMEFVASAKRKGMTEESLTVLREEIQEIGKALQKLNQVHRKS
uniref:Uncharacterized protein n=1 Tax=Guillardia theta TaxID=55529 RepID=A0A7S4JQA0_GUITH|mmetsp:Transcript_17897/g.58818  ORF Transcript_17897/g.58818 Transcript_17897/m.58818 type:complete len:150 (+) Transcript_17897:163-612(+)